MQTDASLNSAWLYFGSLTLLLALFLTAVTLLMVARRRRERGRRSGRSDPTVDPWAEAGRRAEPWREPRQDA